MKEKISVSRSLLDILEHTSDEKKEVIFGAFAYYKEQYDTHLKANPNHGKDVVHAFNIMIEEEMNNTFATSPFKISCLAGCSHCCHQMVDISQHEAELLLYFVEETGYEVDRDRLLKQVKAKTDKEFMVLPKEVRRCVFLNEKDECSAYQYRPSACRKLVVASKPEKCDIDLMAGAKIEKIVNTQAEVINSVIMNSSRSVSMAEQLLDLM